MQVDVLIQSVSVHIIQREIMCAEHLGTVGSRPVTQTKLTLQSVAFRIEHR